jgi:hypothetical protein
MGKDLKNDIVSEVKEFLELEEDLSPSELFKRLREYRNELHPDNFVDDSTKIEAEYKFKDAQNLLDKLFKYLEKEKLNTSSSSIQVYKPIYDHVELQHKYDLLKVKISEYEELNAKLLQENNDLRADLNRKTNEELKNDIKELEANYKPTRKNIISVGISFILTSLVMVLTKVEEVSILIKKYSPINETYINTIIFILFVMIVIDSIKKYVEHKIIERRIEEINSSAIISKFIEYLKGEEMLPSWGTKKFREIHVHNFLSLHFYSNLKWLSKIGFTVYQIQTIDKLKNIFIGNLLNKRLIEISHANLLDRNFIIKCND